MKRILLIITLYIGLSVNGWSQITAAEYFIDSDPGVGNATSLTITEGTTITGNFDIPTSGLANGLHVLHIRVRGTNNVWSLYFRDYFYIHTTEVPPTGSDLSAAEYFIDSDPGVGNGIPLTISTGQTLNNTFSIPTTGLDNGLHVLHIRVKDLDDTWSLFYRDYFYIQTISNTVATPIVAAEYFFDSDPGVGNGFSIPITEGFTISETLAIPVPESMTDGTHYLYLRVKNLDNNWSAYIFEIFNVDSTLSVEENDNLAFQVYPNPTSSILNIEINSASNYDIQLLDMNGKVILSRKPIGINDKIDFSKYAKGVYLLQIKERKTNKRYILKIVKT